MTRRDLLIGAGCVAALGTAELLRPRRSMSLLGKDKLAQLIPTDFGVWRNVEAGGIVAPKTPGSLADTLYGETVGRTYVRDDGAASVMLLIAHGDSQSDLLQLHRPESCYPAVGFELTARRREPLPIARNVTVPSVGLTARAGERIEDVLYWTRLGEFLPTTAGEQRMDRIKTAIRGYVADGILVRASTVRGGAGEARFALLGGFLSDMIEAVPAAKRASLIGSERARALA